MLDILMPSDAPRKHSHDHGSAHAAPTPGNHGSFFVQMPLSIVGSFLRRSIPSPAPIPEHVEPTEPDTTTPHKQPMPEVNDTSLVSFNASRPASPSNSIGTSEKSKKRAPRSKTSYLCARPPKPIESRSKLHIRPKVILQLHQVLATQRPKPTYEVVPFSLLPQRSTRRLARTFNTSDRLCPNDLLIVKAEAYDSKEVVKKSEDESWGSREVVGVICPAKGDKETTEICMDDGISRWEVTHMPNGGFELNTTDDHGLNLKARWVPKVSHSRRVSGMSTSSQISPTFPSGQDEKKYTFSTISPTSRRHPVIATMNQARIDIMDSYSMPLATSPSSPGQASFPQSPVVTPASIDVASFMDKSSDQVPIQTDDALRKLIVVSGIWILQQNHSPLNVPGTASTTMLDSSLPIRPTNHRTLSMSFVDTSRSASPASTIDENRRALPRMLRTSTERLPRCLSFTDSSHLPVVARSPNASPKLKTRSRRANSTGNANLHSMSGSMRKRYGLAFEGESVPESEEERQGKYSAELLRIKELALPAGLERISSDSFAEQPPPVHSSIVIPPSSDGPKSATPLLSPALPDTDRTRKTQSAYNPVDTVGMWDSGVHEGPGLRSRPTSMFVLNEKKRKQEKKRGRSKDNDKGVAVKKNEWHRFKTSLKGLFKRDKA